MGKSLHPPKDIVRARSEGLCERCGVFLTGNTNGFPDDECARSIHHRQPQRCGGRDSVFNLVNICITCHKLIHDDEGRAAKDGFIVSARQHPAHIPFLSRRGWVQPRQDGSLVVLDFEGGRAERIDSPDIPMRRAHRTATRQRHRRNPSRRRTRVA